VESVAGARVAQGVRDLTQVHVELHRELECIEKALAEAAALLALQREYCALFEDGTERRPLKSARH
jgi:hypothetical protein